MNQDHLGNLTSL